MLAIRVLEPRAQGVQRANTRQPLVVLRASTARRVRIQLMQPPSSARTVQPTPSRRSLALSACVMRASAATDPLALHV